MNEVETIIFQFCMIFTVILFLAGLVFGSIPLMNFHVVPEVPAMFFIGRHIDKGLRGILAVALANAGVCTVLCVLLGLWPWMNGLAIVGLNAALLGGWAWSQRTNKGKVNTHE